MQKLYFNPNNLGQRRCWPGWLGIFFLLVATLDVRATEPVADLLEKIAMDSGATNTAQSDHAQSDHAQSDRAQGDHAQGNDAQSDQDAQSVHKPDLIAGEEQLAGLGHAVHNLESKNMFGDPIVGSPPGLSRQDWLLILAVIVGGGIAIKKLLPGILGSMNTWNLSPIPATAWSGAAEEKTFSEFAVSFRVGPVAAPRAPTSSFAPVSEVSPVQETESRGTRPSIEPRTAQETGTRGTRPSSGESPEPKAQTQSESQPQEKAEAPAEAKQEPVATPSAPETQPSSEEIAESEAPACVLPAESPEKFFETVADDFTRMRKCVSQSGGDSDAETTLKNLRELLREMRSFKNKASLPELLPIWQMSAALEGLISQLVEKPASINASNLNTVSGGVELLQTLSVPGLKPDLVTEPPLRVLAVDDDAICRHAVSFALKKALNPPQLESKPEAALALAEKQPYDLILLDVEMPGMDGFELCSRIRKTELNRETPILFVTRHSDYEAQAKSTLVGGQDLIAKPFMIFEITVKTLTLLIRGRLKSKEAAPATAAPAAESASVPVVA